MNLTFPETSHWPTFLPLIVWVYLHSNLCSGLQKTHLFRSSVLAENAFGHEIATQGHSRSSILQSVTGRQGVAYCHIILLALSLKIPKKYPLKSPKIAVVINPTLIWRPRQEKPPRISPQTLYLQKLESLVYIFVADSMGLSSFKFVQGLQRRIFSATKCVLAFKVIQGHPRSMILVPIESEYATSY